MDKFQPGFFMTYIKTIKIILITVFFFSAFSDLHAQNRKKVKRLIDLYGQTAYSYFLSANRPGFGVDAYTIQKGKYSISSGVSYSDETIEIPLSISYGISNRLEVFAGFYPYTESYNFSGSKIRGFGDSYLGAKYVFQKSDKFSHAVQSIIKLPTASSQTELGTGKFDICFGIAQGFYTGNFGYDISLELNFLQRRDIPSQRKYITFLQSAIDSINSIYDYRFEPELIISLGPSYQFSDKFSVYAGGSFSRNTRLNYNSTSIYSGVGFMITKKVGLSLGGSVTLDEYNSWGVSSGFNITL
ncbi:MAG: transporter [Ignavibacteria bacterium]|nr:transporter [Ignavibacteria bacterium]